MITNCCNGKNIQTSSILQINDSKFFQQNKSYHHISSSSLPPPTISPPPPPLPCCIETPVWPNRNNNSINESSSTINPSNVNSSSQQVPLGDNKETNNHQQCLKDIELSNEYLLLAFDDSNSFLFCSIVCLNEVIDEVQETIQKCKRGPICFDPRCITLKRRIGNGYFGDVFLATIPSLHGSSNINLAVKMLKSHAIQQQKVENYLDF